MFNDSRAPRPAASPPNPAGERGPGDYPALLALIQRRLDAHRAVGEPLFATATADLFAAYLAATPAATRQHHNCHACRRFVERYGRLVAIDADGEVRSAFWGPDGVPPYYAPAVAALARLVEAAPIEGVFLAQESTWGHPRTGEWAHLAVAGAPAFPRSLLTAEQAMAEKREDRRVLGEALGAFRRDHVARALQLLESESLYRGTKVLGPIRWLAELMAAHDAAPPHRRAAILWRAVATAPPGYAKPRGAMAGTLLEDLAAGLPFDDVRRRFAAKMHPLLYQRPQAAPTTGNIARGEAIVAQLGLAPSLRRRYATHADILEWSWRPAPPVPPAAGGVFGHLAPRGTPGAGVLAAGAAALTWEKFRRVVLPAAETIELRITPEQDNYAAFLTAADPDAPPIFQWDAPDRRNPVSWYVWSGGSRPAQFGLPQDAWVRVAGIISLPSSWNGAGGSHHGEAASLLLAGAADTRRAGVAIFPEMLKAELREIRSTIEAYSKSAEIEAAPAGSPVAAGLMISKEGGMYRTPRLRVRAAGIEREYTIDRWD